MLLININSRNLHSLEFSKRNIANSGGDYRSPNFHKFNKIANKFLNGYTRINY
jgi:hypothetical protein